MDSIKCFIAVLTLVFSQQAMALFMPDGVQVELDKLVVSNDVGC